MGRRPRSGCRRPGRDRSRLTGLLRTRHDAPLDHLRLTHIGGPTVLIELDGWRILTDPTFDPPGRRYDLGWGTSSRKLTGPAIDVSDLKAIDAVLLTHDHHADNLDDTGRHLLPATQTVVTTHSGAKRLGGHTRGLRSWETTTLESPGRPTITITATPCRHGLPPRPTAEPPPRRRRHRLCAALRRTGQGCSLGLQARRAPRTRRPGEGPEPQRIVFSSARASGQVRLLTEIVAAHVPDPGTSERRRTTHAQGPETCEDRWVKSGHSRYRSGRTTMSVSQSSRMPFDSSRRQRSAVTTRASSSAASA